MPNVFDGNGLQVKTRAELVAELTAQYEEIYGADIDLSSNTPDGQMLNIQVQAILDTQDLLVQIYNSFDPDFAIGKVLDQRVAINGIQRQGGTYTVTPVTVVNSQSVNLYGLDEADPDTDVRDDGNDIFTVADNAGNEWFLQDTQEGLTAGSHILNFRAAVPGAQLTTPNTITVPITVVLGVTSINNPSTFTTLGEDEESDAQLRLRRQRSVTLGSQGYLAGLKAALENITGVTHAAVYENTGGATDGDGIPGHSIWVIVGGTATDADIAGAIYTKRNAGCGMHGETSYDYLQVDGTYFSIYWDEVISRNLFVAFTATSINGTTAPNIAAIRDGLAALFIPGINNEINVNQLATVVQQIDSNTLVTNAGFSSGETQTLTLSGVAASGTFKVNYDGNQSAAINWNDAIGTIQSKVQAITGLSGCLVTGSIASQSLVFNLSGVDDIQGLVFASDNSLATGGAVAITFAHDNDYDLTYLAAKQYQPIVTAENTIITAMVLNRAAAQVETTLTTQLTALGGYGAYTYSILVNNSGASINATTGVYTAGATPSVVDTVKATDKLGNSATTTISVI